jgi:D-alanyl-D-alanine dipeptidase
MEWVRRNYLLTGTTIAIAVFVGFITLTDYSGKSTSQSAAQPLATEVTPVLPILSCFDSATVTISVTTDEACPVDLLNLGNAPLEQIYDNDSVTSQTHPVLLARFEAALFAAKLEGVNLYITSGFRSLTRQEKLFKDAVNKYGSESEAAKWVLPAPYSHHPQGLALDVNYPGDPVGASWLEKNGASFGLCRVYANEWWHFEGVIAPGLTCPPLARNALVDLR